MKKRKKLTREQLYAIKKSIELGRRLQIELPEIAEDFKNGMFVPDIISKYNITELYGITLAVAETATYKAINGHDGKFKIESFEGLIEPGELEKLIDQHLLEGRKKAGRTAAELGTGVHGMTEEEQKRIGNKNYKEGIGIHSLTTAERRFYGKLAYKLGVGIHSLSSEQKREAGKKGGRNAVKEKRGIHGMTEEELRKSKIKGGSVSGKNTYLRKQGIHALSYEQKRKISRDALIKRGFTPWIERKTIGEGEGPIVNYRNLM